MSAVDCHHTDGPSIMDRGPSVVVDLLATVARPGSTPGASNFGVCPSTEYGGDAHRKKDLTIGKKNFNWRIVFGAPLLSFRRIEGRGAFEHRHHQEIPTGNCRQGEHRWLAHPEPATFRDSVVVYHSAL